MRSKWLTRYCAAAVGVDKAFAATSSQIDRSRWCDQIYFISASTRHDNDIERCGVCGDIVECLEKPWDRSDSLDGSVENSGFKSVRTAVQDI